MFEQSRVAIFSDLHLGVHQDSEMWHNIALNWARWFRTELEKREIKDIIFGGDFFHYRDAVAVNTMSVAHQLLDILGDFNIVMIPGNHDSFYRDNASVNSLQLLKRHKNITVLDTVTVVESHGSKIVFCPWGVDIDQIPESDIIVGHFDIESFKMNSFKVCDRGFKVHALLDQAPLVISGHFHQRSDRKFDNGRILYVGNPFQMDFGDVGTGKGIYFLNLEKKTTQFTKNTTSPKHVKMSLSDLVGYGSITDEVKKLFSGNIIKFVVDRHVSTEDANKLFTALHLLKPLQLNIEHEATFNVMLQDGSETDLSGISIKDAIVEFINLMDHPNKKELIDYTLSLYQEVSNETS